MDQSQLRELTAVRSASEDSSRENTEELPPVKEVVQEAFLPKITGRHRQFQTLDTEKKD